MSNGYLTMPYVLWHTGIAAGIIVLGSVTSFSAIPAFWALETMTRAQVSIVVDSLLSLSVIVYFKASVSAWGVWYMLCVGSSASPVNEETNGFLIGVR